MADNPDHHTITPEQLNNRMAENQPMAIIDTLLGDHFAQAHIPGAGNACVFQVDFLDQVRNLVSDQSTPIVLYGVDAHSMDAATAADKLLRAGYSKIEILDGGLAAWHSAGYPLEGTAEVPPASAPALPALTDGTYAVDVAGSIIEWAGRNPNTKHHGRMKLAEGTVTVHQGRITGDFTVDMTSIENLSLKGDELYQVLVDHLKSDDFFFVERFPTARFRMERVQPVANPTQGLPNYNVQGTFELRGVGADLEFPASIAATETGGLTAEAHFDIDRTRWQVIYGSSRFFKHLGMHLVFDLISLELKIVTAPAAE